MSDEMRFSRILADSCAHRRVPVIAQAADS